MQSGMQKRRVLILAAVLASGLALATAKKALSLESPDFKVFYTAARHVFTDPENIYRVSPDRYLYPPSTAVLLTPFAFSDHYPLHQWSWHGLLALLLFCLSSISGAALAAMAVLTRYLAISFNYGQINLVVLSLMALSAHSGLRGRWGAGGAAWALASGLKVYPLALGPMFFPRRRWSAFLWAALVFVFLAALPFLVFGVSLGSQLYSEFLGALESKGLPLHSHNQSIAAFLQRVLTSQEFYLHAVGPMRWGLLEMDPGFLRAVAWAIGGLLVALSWLRAWQRGHDPASCLSAGAFSILFLSHIVWKDYLLFLYFPLRELFARLGKAQAWALGIGVVCLITASSPDLVGAPLATRLDAACIHLWAAGLVWAVWWKR